MNSASPLPVYGPPVKPACVLLPLALSLLVLGCGSDSSTESAAAGTRVAPAGAPYSYEVPAGFEQVPGSFPGEGARYLTTVVPSDAPEHIGTLSAFQWTLEPAQRAYSTKRLLRWLDQQTLAFYRGAGAALAAGERRTVAGRPAVCWRIHRFRNEFDGLVEAEGCAVLGSENAVQLGCTWKPATRTVIERGCRELRETLKVS